MRQRWCFSLRRGAALRFCEIVRAAIALNVVPHYAHFALATHAQIQALIALSFPDCDKSIPLANQGVKSVKRDPIKVKIARIASLNDLFMSTRHYNFKYCIYF